ncbi:Reticulocyte-binding protein 2 a [Phytophthora nicotianae]|uniref:Reticulocyte-binding protein 2 a n=1 Tax=Phytophthora nicotianae TaxID=4792 RepID=A0A0W8DSC1_PHYNI|nr:Reticulocyte-binding protein 2 a [Phytophthora nicotianae]
MSLKLYAEIPYKLLRKRSLGPVLSTPPPLPLIVLSPDDELEEFDTTTQTGFGYVLPHLAALDDPEAGKHVDGDAVAVPPEALRRARLLSDYMTNNEFFQSPRHGFGLETRLIYKRNKELESRSNASTNLSDEISFSATFESGNLDRAYRVLGRRYAPSHELLMLRSSSFIGKSSTRSSEPGLVSTKAPTLQTSTMPFPFFVDVDSEYDLYADTDMNTQGCIQWYFFRVTIPSTLFQQARERGATSLKVRFNIRNMLKRSSLYTEGMLPAVYIDSSGAPKCGWNHAGVNVCYFKNTDTYRHRRTGKVMNYYTLSFVNEFPVQSPSSSKASFSSSQTFGDKPFVAYFAHCYPYTYTRLQRYLLSMQKDPDRRNNFKRRVMCKTIAGNNCDLLTITDFSQDDEKDSTTRKRTAIVISARVHPGESNSSFVMHGILEFLTGNSLEARFLRHHFVFKVVPMLNPDGSFTVIIGAHSPFDPGSRSEAARVRLFPHILCKTSDCAHGGFFSFGDCTFSVTASKKGTGRVVVWNEMQVLHSYTLEASFFGVDAGVHKAKLLQPASTTHSRVESDLVEQINPSLRHFSPADLHTAGLKVCHALLPFSQVLALQRASTMPLSPKLSGIPTRSRAEQDEIVVPEQRCDLDSCEPPIPVKCFGPTTVASDLASSTKIRLMPLEGCKLPIQLPTEQDMTWTQPQRPASPLLDPVPSNRLTENCDVTSFGLPSEFDQLFSGEDVSMLSLLDHDDLMSEIEAALPDNFQDNPEDDDSAGSESDPSADAVEEEEKEEQQKAPPTIIEEPPATEAEPTELAISILSRNRTPRVSRHLSEPRL